MLFVCTCMLHVCRSFTPIFDLEIIYAIPNIYLLSLKPDTYVEMFKKIMFYLTEMAEYRAVVPALALWNGFEQLGCKSLRWSKDNKKITSITFVCLVFYLMIFFFLFFFSSGDHLFYLNSGPLIFSPVGSCLKKKKSCFLHPVHFC